MYSALFLFEPYGTHPQNFTRINIFKNFLTNPVDSQTLQKLSFFGGGGNETRSDLGIR